MEGYRTIIGYAIADPNGEYPSIPDFGAGFLAEAKEEARLLNIDFADECDGSAYLVMTLFGDGAADMHR